MKVRESGMPEAGFWDSLFDVPQILDAMQIGSAVKDVVEFGCGYGTFAVPAARRIQGTLYGLDIDSAMIEFVRECAGREHINNIKLLLRNFVTEGTGLNEASVDYVMLFNILHAENPEQLLGEARRILAPGGRLGVIHWNYDPDTPRGPPMSIRPRPEECRTWIEAAGFKITEPQLNLPPHHYGILAEVSKCSNNLKTERID
jgi:ubiquinone/menaquinone biosynthesis C-methylase UbiE